MFTFVKRIIFGNYYDVKSVKRSKDLVVVLDAVNPENNIAHKWDESMKRGYLNRVRQTYAFIKKAQKAEQRGNEEETLDAWCEVFGDDFRRLSQ